MFKRIKVITLLISVLLVLGIMQLISAGIFINALNNDKENFTVSQLSSQNVAEFTDAWISLNQARVTLNEDDALVPDLELIERMIGESLRQAA